MKELREVAKVFKELSLLYMIQRQRPVYDTGDLYSAIKRYNTLERMTGPGDKRKKSLKGTSSFVTLLNFMPPGFEYGYFPYYGKGTSKAYGPRPFAEEAANSAQVKKTIDNAVKGYINKTILRDVKKQLDTEVQKILK